MRIAHFIATNFFGGPERQIVNHLKRVNSGGHDVLLVSFDEAGGRQLSAEAGKYGIQTILLPAAKHRIDRVIKDLRKLFTDWEPQVVCAHGYKSAFYTLIMAKSTGTGYVSFSRGATRENLKVRIYHAIENTIIRYADRIVAVSKSQAEKLKAISIPAAKVEVIENSVTINKRSKEDEQEAVKLGQELGLPEEATIILSAGRLSPEKGHTHLVNAMQSVCERYPDTHLLLAGDGPLLKDLRSQADALACSPNIHFLGFRTDVRNLYLVSDLFVLPSLSEGLPNVLLEAMTLEVPVIATRVGGVPELIEHDKSGYIAEPGQADSLARLIGEALDNPIAMKEMTKNAVEYVFTHYSPERQTDRLLELYKEVIGE